jgi:hypothetical protein
MNFWEIIRPLRYLYWFSLLTSNRNILSNTSGCNSNILRCLGMSMFTVRQDHVDPLNVQELLEDSPNFAVFFANGEPVLLIVLETLTLKVQQCHCSLSRTWL